MENDLGYEVPSGTTDDRGLYRHSDSKLNNIISRALNRKNVSYAYHTGYPGFLNAQGPYAVYSHDKHKGEQIYQKAKQTKKQAYNRFEDDLVGLQKTRETERDTFFGNIREEQMLVNAQRQFTLQTNRQNQEFVRAQMADQEQRKIEMRAEQVQYKKPHFGPEETAEVIEDLEREEKVKK